MLAISLALSSSLVYGVSDFLGGLKSRSVALLSVLLVSQGTGLILLAIVLGVAGDGPPSGEFVLYAALAGVSEALAVAALYRGLAVGTMSIVAPVAATAPVVPVVVAILLGEEPAPAQGVGIALAVVGMAIISLNRQGGGQSSAGNGTSVLFGLLTALGFGGFQVAMDAASEGGVPWALLVARLTAVSVFAAAFLATRQRLAVRRADLPALALIGVLIAGADAMYAVATTKGLLSVVAVLSSLYPVVTVALARIYLDERIRRPQQIGVVLALLGVVAISALPG